MKMFRAGCQAESSARSWCRYSIACPRSDWLEVGLDAISMAFSIYNGVLVPRDVVSTTFEIAHLGLHVGQRRLRSKAASGWAVCRYRDKQILDEGSRRCAIGTLVGALIASQGESQR